MPRVLSQDLRERVVAAIDGGMSCRAAAARFGVSAASAIRWRQLVVRHGTPAAKPQGGDRRAARIDDLTLFQDRTRPLHQPEPEASLARHAAALETDRTAASTEHTRSKRSLLRAVGRRHVVEGHIDEL